MQSAHIVGSGITVDCGIMYVPNGWWKQVGYVLRPDELLDFVLGGTSDSITNISA
jgi:hypothetical protein